MAVITATGGPIAKAAQRPTRDSITDGVITAKVRAALGEEPLTASYDIHVDTLAGIVELTGFVETESVRIEAMHVAELVRGVRRVENSLDVRRLD